MTTLHLPSRDKVILSRTETRKKVDEWPDWDKMMLSHAAMRALFMDNPDVILTIDKLKVISRDHKHPQNRKDPAAQPKDSVKPAEKTAKATTQAIAEVKSVPKTPVKTPSSGKSSAKAIQAALTA